MGSNFYTTSRWFTVQESYGKKKQDGCAQCSAVVYSIAYLCTIQHSTSPSSARIVWHQIINIPANLCTLFCAVLYRVQQCELYSRQCAFYSKQCTLYSRQCAFYSKQCTFYSRQCAFYSKQCTLYSRVIPCEKSEKKMTGFFLDFWLEKSKVLFILGIKITFFFLPFFCDFWPFYWFFLEISNQVNLLKWDFQNNVLLFFKCYKVPLL